jgi:uncharacterized protein with HEPN domain
VDRILTYIGDADYASYVSDRMLQDAVERNLIIIGEAASRLPRSITQRERGVEWGLAAGMRNIVVHEYFGVDSRIVWDAISHELLALADAARRLLEVDSPPDIT